jgi:hypothetical protein
VFWQRVVAEYTDGHFSEHKLTGGWWASVVLIPGIGDVAADCFQSCEERTNDWADVYSGSA